MPLQHIKMAASAGWVLIALVIAIATGPGWAGLVALAAFGLLPPLAILLFWNDPEPTMSESIRDAQR